MAKWNFLAIIVKIICHSEYNNKNNNTVLNLKTFRLAPSSVKIAMKAFFVKNQVLYKKHFHQLNT